MLIKNKHIIGWCFLSLGFSMHCLCPLSWQLPDVKGDMNNSYDPQNMTPKLLKCFRLLFCLSLRPQISDHADKNIVTFRINGRFNSVNPKLKKIHYNNLGIATYFSEVCSALHPVSKQSRFSFDHCSKTFKTFELNCI